MVQAKCDGRHTVSKTWVLRGCRLGGGSKLLQLVRLILDGGLTDIILNVTVTFGAGSEKLGKHSMRLMY